MMKLKEGQKVLGIDGKQYLIEKGDAIKTLKEGVTLQFADQDIIIDNDVRRELKKFKGHFTLNDGKWVEIEFPTYALAKKWYDEYYSNGDFEVEEFILNEKASIKEGPNKLPYDVLIDGIVDQDTGFNVRQYKNKNYRSFTVTKGTPYEFVYVNKNSDGSVMFRIDIFTEIGDVCYSCLAYDSVKDARSDGWPV